MKEDKYIWAQFKEDAGYALSYIYHQNIDFLFSYGKRFTRDEDLILDMIQDLFYDLIRYRKNLADTDNIRLYLIKSFRRILLRGIDGKKKLRLRENDPGKSVEIAFSVEDEFIEDEEQSRKLELIKQGISELNAKQREIFYYRFTLGYDYDQISDIMPVSGDSARQMVSRGIQKLKDYMREQNISLLFIFRYLKK